MQNRLSDAREEKPLQKADKCKGHPRTLRANQLQIEMRIAALDSLVPEDHKVRIIWEMAQEYDLSEYHSDLRRLLHAPSCTACSSRYATIPAHGHSYW